MNIYLTTRGAAFAVVAVVAIGLAAAMTMIGAGEAAAAASAAATAMMIVMAVSHASVMLAWLAANSEHFDVLLSAESEAVVGSSLRIEFDISNGHRIPIYFLAARFDCSSQLSIRQELFGEFVIGSGERVSGSLDVEVTEPGRAFVFGLAAAIGDWLGFFRAELHRECRREIVVGPVQMALPAGASDALYAAIREASYDLERTDVSLRPYRRGDRMGQIVWRTYARRLELMTMVPDLGRGAKPRLVILLDSGPYMRGKGRHGVSSVALVRAAAMFDDIARGFDEVSIVSYDLAHSVVICMRTSIGQAKTALVSFVCNAVGYRNPRPMSGREELFYYQKNIVNLMKQLKMYKKVSFEFRRSGERFADISGLVAWGRGELAGRAMELGDSDAAGAWLRARPDEVIERMVGEWSRDCVQPPLPSNVAPVDLSDAVGLIRAPVPGAVLVWVSDFSVPMTDAAIGEILGVSPGGALGIRMRLADGIPGLDYRAASVTCGANIEKISASGDFKFYDGIS